MSPNIPANVLRKFFIVSSASSCNVCCATGAAGRDACCADDALDVDDILDDWEATKGKFQISKQ